MAAVLSASKTPHISYSSTSTDLTASYLYPSFLRTIPPDNYQALSIAHLLKHFKWTYVNIVAMDDKYGRVGVMKLQRELKNKKICVSLKEIYDIRNDKNRTRNVIRKLKATSEATVIILWCERFDAMNVLHEAQRQQLYHRTWIGTEAYGNTNELFTIDYRVIQGMFGVVPYQIDYEPFISKLKTITPNHTDTNPWLDDYWRKKRHCVRINVTKDTTHRYECKEKDVNLSKLPTNKHVNVINAVYAVAYGLHNYLKAEGCNATTKKSGKVQPAVLLKYIKGVNFTGTDGNIVSFNDNGNPVEARYNLTNLHYNRTIKKFFYVDVGTWHYRDSKYYMTWSGTERIQFTNLSSRCPRSSCAESCKPGHQAVTSGDLPCCWKCVPCPKEMVQPLALQFNCSSCPGDSIPNGNQTSCKVPLVSNLKVSDAKGIISIVFVALGYIIVITSMIIFFKYKHTAIMNASNKELSWIQLISFIFLLAFPLSSFNTYVTGFTCALHNFYFVCFYTIVMSINFTKADRLLRVFNAGKIGILRCRERSNKMQLITVAALTVFGLLLLTFVQFTLPITVAKRYHNDTDTTLYITYFCSGSYDTHLFIGIGYIQVIALICGVYAFKARRLPETFNEAKYTSFAMFTFLLIWLVFVPVYFSTDSPQERRLRWCFMSLVVSIQLFLFMYLNKLYIILFRSDLNTKEHVAGEIKAFNMAIAKKSLEHLDSN